MIFKLRQNIIYLLFHLLVFNSYSSYICDITCVDFELFAYHPRFAYLV